MSNVQTLELQIRDNAKQAAKGLDALTASLSRLKSAMNGAGGLERLNAGLGKLLNTLNQVSAATAKLTDVENAFNRVSKAASSMNSSMKRVKMPSEMFKDTAKNADRAATAINKAAEATERMLIAMGGGGVGASRGINDKTTRGEAWERGTMGLPGPMGLPAGIQEPIQTEFQIIDGFLESSSAAIGEVVDGMEHVAPQVRGVVDDMGRAAPEVRGVADAMDQATASTNSFARNVPDRMAMAERYMRKASEVLGEKTPKNMRMSEEAARSLGQSFIDTNGQAGLMAMRISKMTADLGRQIASGEANPDKLARSAMTIMREQAKLDRLRNAAGGGGGGNVPPTGGAGAGDEEAGALDRIKERVLSLGKALKGLGSSIARIAKNMIIRRLLRNIASAFKEGLDNVRQYSKAIGGLYSQDMDKLDNSLLKMKNSLGAALAPAIQALLPVIQQLISMVITAANWVNQFLAILNGQSHWTKAIDVTAADFEKTKNGAAGAHKEMKNLLADWDELNIIQSESGSGGGSGGNATDVDYKKMFTESYAFEGGIKDTINFLKDNLPLVNGMVAGLAAALLGLPGPAIAITIGLAMSWSSGADIAKNGITKENIISSIGGALATTLGGAYIGAGFFGAKGAIVGAAIGFTVSVGLELLAYITNSHKQFDEQFQLSQEDFDRYVATKMFKGDVRALIELADVTVGNVDDARKAVARDLVNAMIPLNLIHLGLDGEESYKELQLAIFGSDGEGGLVGSIREFAEQQKTLIKTNFTLVPIHDQAGVDISSQFIKEGLTGWTEIENYVSGIGKDLGKLIAKGMTEDGLSDLEEDMLDALTNKLTKVSQAITGQQIANEAKNSMVLKINNGEMNAVDAFIEYQKDLKTKYSIMYQDTIDGYSVMVKAYEAMAETAESEAERAEYLKKADRFRALQEQAEASYLADVQRSVDAASEPGRNLSRNALLEGMTGKHLLYGAAETELQNAIAANKNAGDAIIQAIDKSMRETLGGEYGTYKRAVEMGIIQYSDLFSKEWFETFVNALDDNARAKAIEGIREKFGIDILVGEALDPSNSNTFGAKGLGNVVGDTTSNVVADIQRMRDTPITLDTTGAQMSMNNLADAVDRDTKNIISNIARMNSYLYGYGGHVGNPLIYPRITMRAAGGFPDTGEMFIANEAGPEMIGRIGSRTAVANSDQIVSGVASGVAEGQAEQNALLRTQNALLRQLVNKNGTVKVEPSAAWGRFNQQANHMWAVNHG